MMTAKVRAVFFELLRSALWQQPMGDWAPMTMEEWQDLYAEAKRHALLGVLYDALPKRSGIPAQLALDWLLAVRGIENGYALQRAVYDAQCKAWEKRDMRALLLKGLTVADMYPKPEHRSCGDLDWYFYSEEGWTKAGEVAKANGLALTMDSDGDVHYQLSGVVVEHHHRWNDASSVRARAVLDALEPSTPVAQLAMLNVHILKHALVGGIGLRQLCDLALAYRWYEGQYERADLLALYEAAGLAEWNTLLEGVLCKWLGCPLLTVAEGYEADIDKFGEMVLEDGNFGSHDSEGSLERLVSFAKGIGARRRFFRRYAPAEFSERLKSLVKGRLTRKSI